MFGIRAFKPKYLFSGLSWGLFEHEFDITDEYEESTPKGGGFAGIKRIFYKQADGNISPEIRSIYDATSTGFVVGAFYGGCLAMATAPERHFYENMATQYTSHMDAARSMQRRVMLEFSKGALSIGWRAALFITIFQTTATFLYAYTGEMRATNYMVAGGVTGMLYKFHDGPKASFSGTVFGSLLGLLAGGVLIGILHISGRNIEMIYKQRSDYLNEQEIKQRQKGADRVFPEAKEAYDALAAMKK